MTNLEAIQKLQEIAKDKPYEFQAVEDLFEMLRIFELENKKQAHLWNKDIRKISAQQVRLAKSDSLAEKFYFLNKRSLLFDACFIFILCTSFSEYSISLFSYNCQL
jgi:hypothetical protein